MTDDDLSGFGADEVGRRLGLALSGLDLSAAPVAAVVRKGKAMRLRRRIGVAAGIVVVAATAIVVPGLIRQAGRPVPAGPAPKPSVIKVLRLAPQAKNGVIAQGTINGKPWRIIMRARTSGSLCSPVTGRPWDCEISYSEAALSGAMADGGLNGGTGGGGFIALYGAVSNDVLRTSLQLSDGRTLDLYPVSAFGHRVVGVELTASLSLVKAVAYGRHGEVGYSIPFPGREGELPQFVSWLLPGQVGFPRATATIGSITFKGASVSAVGFAGPWGFCVNVYSSDGHTGSCVPVQRADIQLSGAVFTSSGPSSVRPRWFIGLARPLEAYRRLSMSDGSSVRVRVVRIAGHGLYLVSVPAGPRIVSWSAYAAAGHQVGGGNGAPDGGK